MQIPRVGVEHEHLLGRRADDARMAVTDVRHIVVGVEVATAGAGRRDTASSRARSSQAGGRRPRRWRPMTRRRGGERVLRRPAARTAGTPLRLVEPIAASRGSVRAIGAWLIARYGSSGRWRCWRAAMHTLAHSAQQHQSEQRRDLVVVERAPPGVAADNDGGASSGSGCRARRRRWRSPDRRWRRSGRDRRSQDASDIPRGDAAGTHQLGVVARWDRVLDSHRAAAAEGDSRSPSRARTRPARSVTLARSAGSAMQRPRPRMMHRRRAAR